MNDDRILSLCVSVKSHQGKDMLYRIADVSENNELIKFFYNSALPREDISNRNMIFSNPRETQAEGTVAFWEWHSDGDRQFSYIDHSGISFIEYIRVDGVSTIEELRIAFLDGINIEPASNQRYLVEFSREDDICLCVLCKSSDFVLLRDNYVLIDSIYRLDYYEITSDSILDINTNYLPKFNKRIYCHLELPEKVGTILVRTPADTVRQAILKRIARCTEGFSKPDKRIISEFIRNLTSETIVGHIAEECRCSLEDAHEYIGEFAKICERYFSENDFTSSVLLHLLEYNGEIGMKYQETIRAEWESQNAEKISAANTHVKNIMDNLETDRTRILSEAQEAQNRLDSLLIEYEEYEKEKTEVIAILSELKKDYDNKLSLADEVAQKMREKIASAENDLSSFLSEYAMFSNNKIEQPAIKTTEIGNVVTEDPEAVTDATELFEYLKENLEAVGVDKIYCAALAAYLLAAHFERIPLTIAGYGADLIIDAVSATLYNKSADRLFVEVGAENIPSAMSSILAVHNGFGSMARVLSSSESYVFFVAQTSEELMLEPRSVYNYALPLYTEYFITDNHIDDLYGSISTVKFDFSGKEQKPSFPEHLIPMLAYRNYKRLLGTTVEIHTEITKGEILLLTTLPLMLSLGKKDELIELLSSLGLSDNDKSELYRRIGENE